MDIGSESQQPIGGGNILRELLNAKSQAIHVAIWSWDYKMSASVPRGTPRVLFQWQGMAITSSKRKVSVIGEFIIMDDSLLKEWSGHPFEGGEVRLIEGENKEADTFISMEVRINEKCCNEIWKSFVLGLCGREKGGVSLKVVVKSPTLDDWESFQSAETIAMLWHDQSDDDRIAANLRRTIELTELGWALRRSALLRQGYSDDAMTKVMRDIRCTKELAWQQTPS